MKQAARDDVQRMIAEAEKDLQDAEMLLRYEGYYPLCRLAYLAAEKAMRGLLVGKNQQVADQSSLSSLSQQVEVAEPALGPLTAALRSLERFAPPAPRDGPERTTSPPPLYSREAAKGALALAQQAVVEAKRSLTAPS